MEYIASASIERKTKKYFPIIKFYNSSISDSYFINLPQETRNEALKVARKYIKNIKLLR